MIFIIFVKNVLDNKIIFLGNFHNITIKNYQCTTIDVEEHFFYPIKLSIKINIQFNMIMK